MANFNKINIDGVPYDVEDTTARQSVAAEESAREQADTQLGQQIAAETSARQQADTQLGQQISEETEAREQADTQLSSKINKIYTTYINVKTYGAKGDGVTDDTEAIKKAVSENGGCAIYFPAGVYIISSPITLKDHQGFVGDGPENTVITASASFKGNSMIQSSQWSESLNNNNNYGYNFMQNIAFNGAYRDPYWSDNAEPIATQNYNGLMLGGFRPVIFNTWIYNFPGVGCWFSDPRTATFGEPAVEPMVVGLLCKWNGEHGMIVGNGSHDGNYVNCTFASNSRKQHNTYHNLLILQNNANGRFVNCHMYSDAGKIKAACSLYTSGGPACRFENCDIEGAANTNAHINADNSIFVNTAFYAAFGTSDVFIETRCTFIGCMFGEHVVEPGMSDPGFDAYVLWRNIDTEPLDCLTFEKCIILDGSHKFITYVPGTNANHWYFDIIGKSSVDPIDTSFTNPTWHVSVIGDFPTPYRLVNPS